MSNHSNLNLVGCEIEGRWQEMPPVGELDYDGSVKFEVVEDPPTDFPEEEPRVRRRTGRGQLGETIDPDGPLIGEAVSDPMPPEPLTDWLEENYPNDVNPSCGLHVHVSVQPHHYQWLMDEEFYDFSMDRLRQFGQNNPVPDRYFRRLDGRNDTCRDVWDPDNQMHGGHDTRYRIWNFHAHRAHGTFECRVFPAYEDISLAQDSIMLVCDIVCDYISDYDPDPVVFDTNPKPLQTREITV